MGVKTIGKIPISYKAYDNKYAVPMGISLSVGGTCLIGGLMSNEVPIFIIGIIGIILFIIFKILNSLCAKEEAEQNFNEKIEFLKKEVEDILKDQTLNDEQKIEMIIKISENGNQYATLFLNELLKRIEE